MSDVSVGSVPGHESDEVENFSFTREVVPAELVAVNPPVIEKNTVVLRSASQRTLVEKRATPTNVIKPRKKRTKLFQLIEGNTDVQINHHELSSISNKKSVNDNECCDSALENIKTGPDSCTENEELTIKVEKVFKPKSSLSVNILKHSGVKPHVCKECGAKYAFAKELIQHMNRHTGATPYTSRVCGKGFAGSRNLRTHSKVHEHSTQHLCTICGKCFRSNLHLRKHTSSVHVRTHECDVCKKMFPTALLLKWHNRQHTGERPFGCAQCGKTFGTMSGYSYHSKTHDTVKPYICSVCGHGYVQQATLNEHMRMPTGEKKFQCDLCKLRFCYDKALHACDQCDKKFVFPGLLKTHMRSRHGAVRLKCDHCNQQYVHSRSLSDHMAKMHGVRNNLRTLLHCYT